MHWLKLPDLCLPPFKEVEEEQVSAGCAAGAFSKQMAQEWLCSSPGHHLLHPSLKCSYLRSHIKDTAACPAPAGCTLKWFLPQASPDLTEGALFEALITFLIAHLCKSCMFHWCYDQKKGIHWATCKHHCDYQVFRSPFTPLLGLGSGLGKRTRLREISSIPCPHMDKDMSMCDNLFILPC